MGIYPINNSRKRRLNIISMIFTSRSGLGTVFKGESCYDCHDVDTVAVTVKRLHRFRKQYGGPLLKRSSFRLRKNDSCIELGKPWKKKGTEDKWYGKESANYFGE